MQRGGGMYLSPSKVVQGLSPQSPPPPTIHICIVMVLYEGFYNFSDICVPVDLFTPSLYKFDVTGKDIEDNHTVYGA